MMERPLKPVHFINPFSNHGVSVYHMSDIRLVSARWYLSKVNEGIAFTYLAAEEATVPGWRSRLLIPLV